MISQLCEPASAESFPQAALSGSGLQDENYRIAPSDVGLGVFAARSLKKGQRILSVSGPIIDFAETKRRGPRECMALQIGPDRYIDTQPPAVFVNHSCDPNAGIVQDRYLVALRDIPQGAEIRFDYSTTMQEQSFTMRCLCDSPRCRGTVQDFSTLAVELQQHYHDLSIVMAFIKRPLEKVCGVAPAVFLNGQALSASGNSHSA